MKTLRPFVLVPLLALLVLVAGSGSHADAAEPEAKEVLVLTIHDEIGKITERYVSRGIHNAEKHGSELVVIQLDTPGGLLMSTQGIVQTLLNAKVPVAVYVSPRGAFAASAGKVITAAANFAVMTEGSSIGAASPVGSGGEDLPKTLSEKSRNITVAMVSSIADKRGRNKDALISTVTDAKAFSAHQAVDLGVADFIAQDLDDLLAQLNGKTTDTASGTVTLNTANLSKSYVGLSIADKFVSFLANPNLVIVLLVIGGVGVLIEFIAPGLIIPGVVGAMALILALVGLGSLPFNWAGIVLLALAAGLIFFEVHAPGLGFLGVAGGGFFILGALLLFTVNIPTLPGAPIAKISLWLLVSLSAAVAAFALVAVRAAIKSRKLKYTSPGVNLVGQTGVVALALAPKGTIQLAGERWTAVSDEGSIPAGEQVKVVAVEGLTLKVKKNEKSGGVP